MRQVPASSQSNNSPSTSVTYLLLGSGRLARHLSFYLPTQGVSLRHWSRGSDSEFNSLSPLAIPSAADRFRELASDTTVILAALADTNLHEVYEHLSPLAPSQTRWVHFSGSFRHPHIFAAHPLMTFADTLHAPALYESMAFVGCGSPEEFAGIFPILKNRYYQIEEKDRILYHALCAMSGNFSQLLWQATENAFLRELGLPKDILEPYKIAVFNGILRDPARSLTGPLARGDQATVEQHIEALGEVRGQVYTAMKRLFENERRPIHEY